MSRPIKSGLDYFPHDTDSLNDEKIEAMRSLYGNDGYAFYFILLERIYRTSKGEISIQAIEDKVVLADKVKIDLEIFDKILNSALNLNLFSKKIFLKKQIITSSGIKKRFKQIQKERKRKRNHYFRAKLEDRDLDVQNSGESTQSKVKKSKANILYDSLESIKNDETLISEFKEKLNLTDSEIETEFYSMKVWLESKGKPKKNYKMFCLNWLKRYSQSRGNGKQVEVLEFYTNGK